MKPGLLFIMVFFCVLCYSQNKITYSIAPNWDNHFPEPVKTHHIKSDYVYYYKKKNNNTDSILIMIQYYDSSGNRTERDEYNFNGKLFRITTYTYIDNILLNEQVVSKDIFFIKNSSLVKKVKTYDHDSAGNVITEKEYSFFGDSLKAFSVATSTREYDSSGNITREYRLLPGGKQYLHHTYEYTNGILTEVKNYGSDKNWIYSYIYEYDEKARSKKVFLYNDTKTLNQRFYYDNQKRLVEEHEYLQGLSGMKQTYFYTPEGLLERQVFEDPKGFHYYYKHFYAQ